VEGLGAKAAEGELRDVESLTSGMQGCSTVYHCAASAKLWGDWEKDFVEVNIEVSFLPNAPFLCLLPPCSPTFLPSREQKTC
jgi:hypothetical protein